MSVKLNPMVIYKLLPKTNCKECGYTCMAFSIKLLQKEVKLEDCKPLFREEKYRENRIKLEEILRPLYEAAETLIRIDDEKCIGCGNCIIACPANVNIDPEVGKGKNPVSDEVVFTVVNGKIKVLNIKKCRRYPPHRTNCRICEQVCLSSAIKVVA
ncbi:MAG: 4Fe-4S dicluster domain-containing protein [archaeon GB-1867-035]|nr:4Fe-4S dicluster domain-containing protein [Candidatus Culexmicrobium profundum]